MRILVIAATLVLTACAQPAAPRAWRAVDLDRPGAMEALQRENPAHHAKVQKILAEAESGGGNVDGLRFFMPGLGVQTRVTFAVDGRDYTALIRPR